MNWPRDLPPTVRIGAIQVQARGPRNCHAIRRAPFAAAACQVASALAGMNERVSMTFGPALRRVRVGAQLTQEELAERSGLSVRGISDLERGERTRPHPHTVRLLADALQLQGQERAGFVEAARGPAETGAGPVAVPPTRMVGREALLAALGGHLHDPGLRILSLVGPGGVGKTRVATALFQRHVRDFADGGRSLSLANLHDPGLVTVAIAHAFGLTDFSDRPPRQRLFDHLRDREALLVLDNFEHLLAAGPLVVELAVAAPRLKVVLTTRAVLHVSGEQLFAVPPLALEDAVTLFTERAASAGAVETGPIAAVEAICERLDCLPLAIELAAARAPVLPPSAIAAHLHRSLDLLTVGSADMPERQQTLRKTIEWSYQLLTSEEQMLLRQCAVFDGGWTVEAAAAVGGGLTWDEALGRLATLCDHQMVRPPRATSRPRFLLMETIREFAAGALEQSGEGARARDLHAQWCLHLAEEAAPGLYGLEQGGWFDRLDEEASNLRAALDWQVRSGAVEAAARLASLMSWPWLIRGHLREGAGWFEKILSAGGQELPAQLRAGVVLGLSMMVWALADYARSVTLAEEAAGIYRRTGDTAGRAAALNYAARSALERAELDRAEAAIVEAITLYAATGNRWGVYFSQAMIGRIRWAQGDLAGARACLLEHLPIVTAAADSRGLGFFHAYLSGVATDAGDPSRAESHASESLLHFRTIGDRRGIGYALMFLAATQRDRGQHAEARASYGECLTMLRDFGPRLEVAWALEGCAELEQASGQAQRCLLLSAAAARIRSELGAPRPAAWQARFDALVAAARSRESEAGDALWAEGGSLTATGAVDLFLSGWPVAPPHPP